jgi:hypothetical protein
MKECTATDKIAQRGFEPRKQMDQYPSVEFSISGCTFVYQFKIWDTSLKEKCVLVKEDSDLLNHLKAGDILNLKYYTTDSSSPIKYLKTEIRHIRKGDKGGFKGLYLVGLSILENQNAYQ